MAHVLVRRLIQKPAGPQHPVVHSYQRNLNCDSRGWGPVLHGLPYQLAISLQGLEHAKSAVTFRGALLLGNG